jgi:hypothetical protein
MKLNEACTALLAAVEGTEIAVNFDKDRIQIHWFGVAHIECTPAVAAKVIPMLRQLEQFGMEDF